MENTEEQITAVEIVSSDVIFQQDKAMIDQQIATAKQYPRNITRATTNILAIVTMDKETAATCTYSVPRGGKAITGPSVHLAKIIAQQWGNLRAESKVVGNDGKQITSQAICFDLESNVAIKVEVKKSIIGKNGKFNEDMQVVSGNAANSIALRNAILSVVPRAVVDKAYKAAQKTIIGDVSDETKLIARRKQVIDSLKDTYNVTEAEILASVGKAALSHLTADDLVTLIGVGTAIKEGDTTVEYAFKGKKDSKETLPTPEELQILLDDKIEFVDAKELKEAKRIIDGKETASYKKLFDILNKKGK